MIQANELRIGNLIKTPMGVEEITGLVEENDHILVTFGTKYNQYWLDKCTAIHLTEERLLKFPQFKHNPIVKVSNQYLLDLGRSRFLSISDAGTPNLMIWIQAIEEKKVTDLVCLHNYDFDGELYVHQLQNLYLALTGKELEVKP